MLWRDIQEQFFQDLFQKNHTEKYYLNSSHSDQRLTIYRNTILENYRHAIEITFPGLFKLIGKTCGDQLAYSFVSHIDHLPQNACLEEWGSAFPSYLHTIHELASLPYLSDYAAYEWLKQLCYIAPDANGLTIAAIAHYDEDTISQSHLTLHPTMQLFQSDYAIDVIDNLLSNDSHHKIELPKRSSQCCIYRHQDAVTTHWLAMPDFTFLSHLHQGIKVETAYANTEEQYPHFDPGSLLTFLIQQELILSFKESI